MFTVADRFPKSIFEREAGAFQLRSSTVTFSYVFFLSLFCVFICLSVCRFVKGNVCRKFAHCFVKSIFLTSCVLSCLDQVSELVQLGSHCWVIVSLESHFKQRKIHRCKDHEVCLTVYFALSSLLCPNVSLYSWLSYGNIRVNAARYDWKQKHPLESNKQTNKQSIHFFLV